MSRREARRGATLVEFALVLPMLLLLTMGMIQFGVIINARLSLSNTMRQVARYSSVNGAKFGADADIRRYAIITASSFGLVLTDSDVIVGDPDNNFEPKENTATEPMNRQRYTTQLPVTLTYNISSKIFLPTAFPGVDILSSRQAEVTAKVMVE